MLFNSKIRLSLFGCFETIIMALNFFRSIFITNKKPVQFNLIFNISQIIILTICFFIINHAIFFEILQFYKKKIYFFFPPNLFQSFTISFFYFTAKNPKERKISDNCECFSSYFLFKANLEITSHRCLNDLFANLFSLLIKFLHNFLS